MKFLIKQAMKFLINNKNFYTNYIFFKQYKKK